MTDFVDADGLPASDVGIWTLEKHERLRKYIESSRAARRKFGGRTAYVDLYCGPGRSKIRETGAFIDGSPLVAWDAGAKHGVQFSEFLIADSNDQYLEAAKRRLEARGAKVRVFPGEAEAVVDQVIEVLDPHGLHLGLLDPFRLGDLPFAVIRKLAQVKRMDLLVHVSAMDLKRDLHNYLRTDGPKHLDRFAPEWRSHVDTKQRAELVRLAIFEHWKGLLKQLGTSANECVEAVENSKSAELYWLVFVARHGLPHKLWSDIANVTPQGRLFS